MMHRYTATALALAALVTATGAAMAQTAAATPEPAPAAPLTANVTLTTNYKFRGQDQSQIGNNGFYKTSAVKPAIQGGFDYAFGESGFYIGNWNSSVDWLTGNSIEMDVYGGYKFKGGPIDWDVGVLGYFYPGNHNGNTTEIYGAGTWTHETIGSFTVKYSHTVSKDYFNYAGYRADGTQKGRGTGYLNIAYAKEIAPKFTLKASVGYTHMAKDIRDNIGVAYPSYVDYNVGVVYDFGGGLTLSGTVQGANKQSAYNLVASPGIDLLGDGSFIYGQKVQSVNKPRFIAALTKTF